MTTDSPAEQQQRLLRWIGNLDHPFYDEERQRHIWYEASAIAFQGMLLGVLAVAVATVWIGGQEAIIYTVGFLAVALVNLALFNRHVATQHAVLIPSRSDITRVRTLAPMGLGVAYFAGVAHALSWGWWPVVGFVLVLAGFIAATIALTKRAQHRVH